MRLTAPFASMVVAATLGLGAATARADDVADAKDLFVRGRDMREHGNCAGAVDLFRKATELYPIGLGSVRNLAECEEQLGHFASSRRAWLDLQRGLLTTTDARKYQGWANDAQQAAARLAPKVATLTIDLNVVDRDGATTTAKGVDVLLDGEPLAPTLVGTPLERDPGRHVIRVAGARVPEPEEKVAMLVAGDSKRVALRVAVSPDPAALAAEGALPVATTPAPDPGPAPGSGRRIAGWVALGVGAASLVGAGISLAVRQGALSTVTSQCPSETGCSPSLESTVSRGQLASTLFTVLGALGVVGVVGGGALVLTAPSSSPKAGFVVVPGLGGASALWRF